MSYRLKEGDTGGLAGSGCVVGESRGEDAREVGLVASSTDKVVGLCATLSLCTGSLFAAGFTALDGGVDGLLVDADEVEVTDVPESGGKTGATTGAGFGEVLGDTFGTGLDSLDPPDVLATAFGPPVALAGLEPLELGAESGERRFGTTALAAGVTVRGTCGVSLSELSEDEVEEDSAIKGLGIALCTSLIVVGCVFADTTLASESGRLATGFDSCST